MAVLEIDLTTSGGGSMDSLMKVIEERRQKLGETTEQACTAMMQTILRSLRAETKVATPNANVITVEDVSGKYYVSWVAIGKGKKQRLRVVRDTESGKRVTDTKIAWDVKDYDSSEKYAVYHVLDEAGEKKVEYLLVSSSVSSAKRYAKKRVKARISRYKGLARLALSVARKMLFQETDSDSVTGEASAVANKCVSVSKDSEGYGSGTVEISVKDSLDYAEDALKNRQSSLDIAVQNAMKSQIGYLEKFCKDLNLSN